MKLEILKKILAKEVWNEESNIFFNKFFISYKCS